MKVRAVCGVPMGGEPGEAPTLMVGSMFYDGDSVVSDPARGVFDREKARERIQTQSDWSERTGLPCCLDVVASTPAAMESYLAFAVNEFDGPIMVDGSSGKVKIAGLRFLASAGVIGRVMYNSISLETTGEEFAVIAECGVAASVVLVMNSADFSAQGKIKLITDENGLVAKAKNSGVQHILIDPGVIDLPSISVVKHVMETAHSMGFLCGAGVHNALTNWKGLTSKMGDHFKQAAKAVINILPTAWDGDFVLYGPVSDAPMVFPAVAMVDAILANSLIERGKIPDASHPLFKIA